LRESYLPQMQQQLASRLPQNNMIRYRIINMSVDVAPLDRSTRTHKNELSSTQVSTPAPRVLSTVYNGFTGIPTVLLSAQALCKHIHRRYTCHISQRVMQQQQLLLYAG